jgi:hypothetical protein
MSLEQQPTQSSEGLTAAYELFRDRVEQDAISISEIEAEIVASSDLQPSEKVTLLVQLVQPKVVLARRHEYMQNAA